MGISVQKKKHFGKVIMQTNIRFQYKIIVTVIVLVLLQHNSVSFITTYERVDEICYFLQLQ